MINFVLLSVFIPAVSASPVTPSNPSTPPIRLEHCLNVATRYQEGVEEYSFPTDLFNRIIRSCEQAEADRIGYGSSEASNPSAK